MFYVLLWVVVVKLQYLLIGGKVIVVYYLFVWQEGIFEVWGCLGRRQLYCSCFVERCKVQVSVVIKVKIVGEVDIVVSFLRQRKRYICFGIIDVIGDCFWIEL